MFLADLQDCGRPLPSLFRPSPALLRVSLVSCDSTLLAIPLLHSPDSDYMLGKGKERPYANVYDLTTAWFGTRNTVCRVRSIEWRPTTTRRCGSDWLLSRFYMIASGIRLYPQNVGRPRPRRESITQGSLRLTLPPGLTQYCLSGHSRKESTPH